MTEVLFSEIWWQLLLIVVCSYLIGNLNFAVLISHLLHGDVRKVGSGNPGTLNMARAFGGKIALLTLFLDGVKGAVPTLTAYLLFRGKVFSGTQFELCDLAAALAGLFVVVGHIYPVFLKFHGGKGVASTVGLSLVADPIVSAISFASAFTFVYFTKLGAIGSFIAITPTMISRVIRLSVKYVGKTVSVAGLVVTLFCIVFGLILVVFAHRGNIRRMIRGEENPTDIREMFRKKSDKKEN